MKLTRIAAISTLATGIGLGGLFGVGIGTAGAAPGQPCGQPNTPACGPAQPGQQQGNPGQGWHQRGIDQGRQDRKPFNYRGQQVTPLPAGNGDGWGFWYLGQWIRL